MNSKKSLTVVVAMSGGVDSSVAAALLVQQGYQVIGATMKLWEFQDVGGNSKRESSCCSIETMNDALSVCQTLGIPHYVFDFQKDFTEFVVDNFVSEYLKGRTPNPCIICNSRIKWETLLSKTEELNADYLSTGHYARILFDPQTNRHLLRKGVSEEKDQSYALWGLTQKSLTQTLFPLGEQEKNEVRKIAEEIGLKTANKPESQEICFVPDDNYRRLLQDKTIDQDIEYFKEGEFVTTDGQVVGKHHGYPNFTIGQRKGLRLAMGKPVYVIDIKPDNNQVIIGEKDDLFSKGLIANQVNWISFDKLIKPKRFFVKIRYRDSGSFGIVSIDSNESIKVIFDEPQSAITPGQSVVFYEEDFVVGGGIINSSLN